MNVTELARILKVNPQELRDLLPQLGFDIGQKAIKIDNRTAQRIIKEWPALIREYERNKIVQAEEEKTVVDINETKKIVVVPKFINVRDFSDLTQIPVNKILSELMKNGVFTSMNEKIDFETALIIGSDLGIEVKFDQESLAEEKPAGKSLADIINSEDKNKLKIRPPVIVVMGHVDHGKTKLLDFIRTTHVADKEAGGITQHIGAYQVERKDRLITFIDTPGHEAFTAMRSRGARVADIAILVVAADDGVKPQTIEACRIIEAAKIPFIVAINKIDKPEADINKTKQELSSQLNISPEDWGGKTICVPVSAKDGTGIEDLLDMILLSADISGDSIVANPDREAQGTVIDSRLDKGAGPVATIIVQNGTLKVGDQLCFSGRQYGKVRALKNYKGEEIKSAGPATPTMILGLKVLPEVGDVLEVGEGIRVSNKKLKIKRKTIAKATNGDTDHDEKKIKTLNIIIKSDFLGSAEAIEESLEKINTEKIKVKIIHKGLGNVTEGDIEKAESAKAQITGFNVKVPPYLENVIREKGIKVYIFTVIYDLIGQVKKEMQSLIEPEFKRQDVGKIKVLEIFRTENNRQIIGGKVLLGKAETENLVEVLRSDKPIAEGRISRLQSGKQDVSEVGENQECGLQYEGKPLIIKGDILKLYKRSETMEKL